MVRHVKLFAPVPTREAIAQKSELVKAQHSTGMDDPLLTPEQAADLIGVKPGLLSRWRCAQEGPAYCKLGRPVRYRLSDVLEFAERRRTWLEKMK
jgi:hypothetical protein